MTSMEMPTFEAPTKPFFFDVDQLPGVTIAEMAKEAPPEMAEMMFELFGRELVTKTIVQSPNLHVYHETAKPGERVKPHRHGTLQVDYVLRGELIFGIRVTRALYAPGSCPSSGRASQAGLHPSVPKRIPDPWMHKREPAPRRACGARSAMPAPHQKS